MPIKVSFLVCLFWLAIVFVGLGVRFFLFPVWQVVAFELGIAVCFVRRQPLSSLVRGLGAY
jgi:hypothetical protein